MGDIADMMLDGTLCEQCGGVMEGEAQGYPRICDDCWEHACPKIKKLYKGTRKAEGREG